MSVQLEQEQLLTTTEPVETLLAQAKGISSKTRKKVEEEGEFEDFEETPKNGRRASSKAVDEDEDEDLDEEDDDWNKSEEDDEWDPDFEEFDLPKSKKSGGKKGADEDEDFKIEDDEEFKDLFNDGGFDDEDDDF